jgi:hypothetical protein
MMQNELLGRASAAAAVTTAAAVNCPPIHESFQGQRSEQDSEESSPGPQSQSPSRLMQHGIPTGTPREATVINGDTPSSGVESDRQHAQSSSDWNSDEESSSKKSENKNDIAKGSDELGTDQTVGKKPIPPNNNVGGDLSIVARLPSRNVSFQFAEILTVPELSKCIHECSYKFIENNDGSSPAQCTFQGSILRDVRITGVVLHMVMNPNDRSFIVLGDALFTPKSKRRSGSSLSQHRRNGISSSNVVKVGASGTGTMPSASITASTSASASTTVPPSSTNNRPKSMIGTSLSGKKRRLVTVKPRTYTSLLHKQSNKLLPANPLLRKNTNPLVAGTETRTGRARSLLSETTMPKINHNVRRRDPQQEEMMRKLSQGMHMVVVDLTDMACVDGCKVGDLVMALGALKLQCLDNSSAEHVSNEGREEDKVKGVMEQIVKYHPLGIMQCDTSSGGGMRSASSSALGGKLEARIIQVVNGTDMNLLQEALKMRRHCLLGFQESGG